MNLFRAFMELDALTEASCNRPELISRLKAAGKNYNFSKYTDAQLYRMVQRLQKPTENSKEPEHDLDLSFEPVKDFECCDFCGTRLTDFNQCPVCDFGEEDLNEDLQYCWFGYYLDKDGIKKLIYATQDSTSHDADEGAEKLEYMIPEPYTKFVFRGTITDRQAKSAGYTLVEWLSASGQPVKLSTLTSQAGQPTTPQNTAPTSTKYTVRIVSYKGRLRALATDGTHPAGWVAFPNDLRQFEGQCYEVDQLIWNGKNYRVAGNIEEI